MTPMLPLGVLLVGLALATLVSEDLTLVTAGLLVARGEVAAGWAIGACMAGILIGDLGLYALGRIGGRALQRAPLRAWIQPQDLARAEAWFARRGPAAILVGRCVPGLRLPTYVAAGVLHVPPAVATGHFALAAALWTPLLVGAAALVGRPLLGALALSGRWSPLLLAAVAAAWLGPRSVAGTRGWRRRRRLLGRWRRLSTWEFWPWWALYPPVLAYVGALALRHGGLTTFTAANPGIPDGGFVGESKSAILAALAPSGVVPPFHVLPDGALPARMSALEAFMAARSLTYPVVLKPDVGERGRGVAIARSAGDARAHLAGLPGPVIAQAYAPGLEYGVFYVRAPDAATGRVTSITAKTFPAVTGDGVRSLGDLVLADGRAVALADAYRAEVGDAAWARVPAPGARVALVEVGTHARGARFDDATGHVTPALEAAIERIARTMPGFHIGRFDLRVPTLAELEAGERLAVVELNGVTAEPTHIYAPGTPLWRAWRELAAVWRTAFAIGAANRARGAPVTPLATLVRRVLARGRPAR